jgi:cobaltochelatase CobS
MFSIVLPAAARNAVRHLVRNHPDYESAANSVGLDASRSMTKDQLMSMIETLGLEQTVMDIAAKMQNAAPVLSATMGQSRPAFRDPDETETETESGPVPESQPAPTPDEYEALAESVLDTVRPVLAPKIVKQVESALAPLLAAAKKPAVEIVRTVTVDESGLPVAPVIPAIRPAEIVGKSTLGKIYGLKGNGPGLSSPVSLWNSADAPSPDPFYVPEPSTLSRIISMLEDSHFVWMVGPPGTGKTITPMEFAARTGRPFVRIALDKVSDPVDLFGTPGLRSGNTFWTDGKVTAAIRRPGTVILLDEITACPPGITMVFQTLLDHRFLVLPNGERVQCAPGVLFCAADNTNGTGDTTGLFHGTNQANAAMVDRFAIMVKVDYLPAKLEAEALSNRTTAPLAACQMVVEFVRGARGLAGFEAQPLSLRRMVAFVSMCRKGFSPKVAFEDCFLSRMAEDERLKLESHFKIQFTSESVFMAALNGTAGPAPVSVSTAPEQVSARNAFQPVDDMN